MESNATTDYRIERWIALFLSLLFFLPFVASAQESPIVTTEDTRPATLGASTLRWNCKAASVEGFRQCALLLDEEVVTWRMATDDQVLRARVSIEANDLRVHISRDGGAWQPVAIATPKSVAARGAAI